LAAVAPEPSARLPLPSSLPVRDGDLQDDRAGAGADQRRSRPPAAVPPRRGDEGPRGGEAAGGHPGGGKLALSTASGSDPTTKSGVTGSELLVVEDLKKHFPVTRVIV